MTRDFQPELPVQIRQALAFASLAVLLVYIYLHLFSYSKDLASRLEILPLTVSALWFLSNRFQISFSLGYFLVCWVAAEWMFSYGAFGIGFPILLLFVVWDLKFWSRPACFKVSKFEALLFLNLAVFLLSLIFSVYTTFQSPKYQTLNVLSLELYKSFSIFLRPLSLSLFAGYFLRRKINISPKNIAYYILPLVVCFIVASLIREHEYIYAFSGDPEFTLHPEFAASILFIFFSFTYLLLYHLFFTKNCKIACFNVLVILGALAYFFPEKYLLSADWKGYSLTSQVLSQDLLTSLFGRGHTWKELFRSHSEYTANQFPLSAVSIITLEGGLLALASVLLLGLSSGKLVFIPITCAVLFFPIFRDPISLLLLALLFIRTDYSDYAKKIVTNGVLDKSITKLLIGAFCITFCYLSFQGYKAYKQIEAGPRNAYFDSKFSVNRGLKSALLVAEDVLFYKHHGFDFARLKRTFLETLKYSEFVKGGSTISMQLAKIRYLNYEKTVSRKLQQVFITVYLEMNKSKDEILQEYLANVGFAENAVGIVAAAKNIFSKQVGDLNFEESLKLVLSIPDPYQYNATMPFGEREEELKNTIKMRIREFKKLLPTK